MKITATSEAQEGQNRSAWRIDLGKAREAEVPTGQSQAGRAFLNLRYTFISVTSYLLIVEGAFRTPAPQVVLLIALALAINVFAAQLPTRILRSTWFTGAILCIDTAWVTGILMQSRYLNTEFFCVYYFVLLLAAIGERLALIVMASVVVAVAYLYGLSVSGSAEAWSSRSLIRLPFLFIAAAFYGHLVERVRSERRRAARNARAAEALAAEERNLRQHRDELAGEVAVRAAEAQRYGQLLERESEERRRLEEQLRQSQKLEAIGRLAAGIAHDFNNQLFIINGYSELLQQRLEAGHPLRGVADEIRKAGGRAAGLTSKLLAFGRRQVLDPRRVDLNGELKEIERLLHRLIREDIVLEMDLQSGLGEVCVDPTQFEQVVFNLVVNARDAMPRGGRLRIETRNVRLGDGHGPPVLAVVPGAYVCVSVRDSGVGIDAETLSHIFEPFFTTKETGKGTGLGLSTVYGIVKQSGGQIDVESTPGAGTCFRIYLPCASAEGGDDDEATVPNVVALTSQSSMPAARAEGVR